jgi:hypothetical protein
LYEIKIGNVKNVRFIDGTRFRNTSISKSDLPKRKRASLIEESESHVVVRLLLGFFDLGRSSSSGRGGRSSRSGDLIGQKTNINQYLLLKDYYYHQGLILVCEIFTGNGDYG